MCWCCTSGCQPEGGVQFPRVPPRKLMRRREFLTALGIGGVMAIIPASKPGDPGSSPGRSAKQLGIRYTGTGYGQGFKVTTHFDRNYRKQRLLMEYIGRQMGKNRDHEVAKVFNNCGVQYW